jgi:hypothetical protein
MVSKACLDVSVAQVLEVGKFSGWKLLVANPALVFFSDLASGRVGARLESSLTLHSWIRLSSVGDEWPVVRVSSNGV